MADTLLRLLYELLREDNAWNRKDDNGSGTGSSRAAIRSQLQSSAGVSAADEWLDACLSFLHPQASGAVTADQVLFQLLHSDLRDVVRSQSEENVDLQASRLLEQALQRSTCNDSKKERLALPQPLLCQVEELLELPSHLPSMDFD